MGYNTSLGNKAPKSARLKGGVMDKETVEIIDHLGIGTFAKEAYTNPAHAIQKVEIKLVNPREGLHGIFWYELMPGLDHPQVLEYVPVALLLDPKYFKAPHVYALCQSLDEQIRPNLSYWITNFLINNPDYFNRNIGMIQVVKVTEIPFL